ncbi:MAG TPA: tRNA epoxyqueuosine(34) reductase QueG [Elusimicrobiota bacterium]|nr:tRNA epoxyqueuosine(34) reductase QueG [Elusimicrobiota bacterium]
MSQPLKTSIIAYAQSLGFERVGVTSADPLEDAGRFLKSWLKNGYAGEMTYLTKDPERRASPDRVLPGARSVIALAMNYCNEDLPTKQAKDVGEARVARYARGRDYHVVLTKRLDAFIRYLEMLAPIHCFKSYVDTGPILERPLARRAGLGFVGKNTMLITRGLGSWVFLADVVTTLPLEPDAPDDRNCGTCRLCLDACPTGALVGPYELDARRCIAYLTIESEGSMDPALRRRTAGWMFGCDICQEVCPHNRRAQKSSEPAFAGPGAAASRLAEVLSIETEEEFKARYGGTPFMRAGRAGLLRNACVAAAVLRRFDVMPLLHRRSVSEENALVREHAMWALEELEESASESPVRRGSHSPHCGMRRQPRKIRRRTSAIKPG